jgi:hypothetical protein
VEGYALINWFGSGDGAYSGTDRTAMVAMNSPITETANWEQATSLYLYLLVVAIILAVIAALLVWRRRRQKQKRQQTKH